MEANSSSRQNEGAGRDSQLIQRYLAALRQELHALPEPERADAVREIASHLAESQVAGRPAPEVLSGLGEPRALARSYLADYYLQGELAHGKLTLWQFLTRLGFTLGAGLVSVFVVPLLSVTAVGFGLVAIASPFLGIIRTFGARWIVIGSSNGWQVPYAWSLPVLVGLGALCGLIAWAAAWLLRHYVSGVLAGYRHLLPTLV
jgi:uncharacterized membrane protein